MDSVAAPRVRRRQRTIREFMGGGGNGGSPVAWDDIHVLATALAVRFDPPLEHLAASSDTVSLEYAYYEGGDTAPADAAAVVVVTLLSSGMLRLRQRRDSDPVDQAFPLPRSEAEMERTATTLAAAVRAFTMRV